MFYLGNCRRSSLARLGASHLRVILKCFRSGSHARPAHMGACIQADVLYDRPANQRCRHRSGDTHAVTKIGADAPWPNLPADIQTYTRTRDQCRSLSNSTVPRRGIRKAGSGKKTIFKWLRSHLKVAFQVIPWSDSTGKKDRIDGSRVGSRRRADERTSAGTRAGALQCY